MPLVAMATATSTKTDHANMSGVKSSFSGGGEGVGYIQSQFAKPGVRRSEAKDNRAIKQRMNEHLTVGSWGCHGRDSI